MNRHATAVWRGTGKEGTGDLTTQSPALNKVKYSYRSRFEEGPGTNPEELIAAAHAGCFSMKLSFVLNAAGFTADEITTLCHITLTDGTITKSQLKVTAKIPGIDKQKFEECAEDAKKHCPVSKLLNAEIAMETTLSD
jgi:osmotically inducible protein OsmC